MTEYARVPGTHFVRDINSMGLTNKDTNALEEYKSKRALLKNQKDEINNIRNELDSIRNDMSEIKNLIVKLIDKG